MTTKQMKRTTKRGSVELYLEPSAGYRISDEHGKVYTPDEARAIVAANRMSNCNLAFQRLITMNFNVDSVREYYAEQNRLHAERRARQGEGVEP